MNEYKTWLAETIEWYKERVEKSKAHLAFCKTYGTAEDVHEEEKHLARMRYQVRKWTRKMEAIS